MKLVFPGGEHGSVMLAGGVHRIGSDPGGAVVLALPGVLPRHFEIHVAAAGANVQRPESAGHLTVNGRPVDAMTALRNGDQLGFAGIIARFVVVEATRPSPGAAPGVPQERPASGDDLGATRLRATPPRFVLRGVSGAIFGKTYAIGSATTIGRSAECDIAIPVDEISRRHAIVRPIPQGLAVEDLGSSNGTFINNRRVQMGQLSPGDELRLDQVRFLLVAPGMELQQAQGPVPTVEVAKEPDSGRWMKPAALGVILASAAFIAWLVATR